MALKPAGVGVITALIIGAVAYGAIQYRKSLPATNPNAKDTTVTIGKLDTNAIRVEEPKQVSTDTEPDVIVGKVEKEVEKPTKKVSEKKPKQKHTNTLQEHISAPKKSVKKDDESKSNNVIPNF